MEVVSLIRCVGMCRDAFLDLKPAMVLVQALTRLGRWPLLLPARESNSSNSVSERRIRVHDLDCVELTEAERQSETQGWEGAGGPSFLLTEGLGQEKQEGGGVVRGKRGTEAEMSVFFYYVAGLSGEGH